MSRAATAANISLQNGLRNWKRSPASVTATFTQHARKSSGPTTTARGLSRPAEYRPLHKGGSEAVPGSQKPSRAKLLQKEPNAATQRKPLMSTVFQMHPKAINCTTFTATTIFAQDEYHPLHIRTHRRLAAFDPSKFHWRIHVPFDVSKRSAVRNWVQRRIKAAFLKELKLRGLKKDGAFRDGTGQAMSGALLVIMAKSPELALEFTNAEAEEWTRFVLDNVMRKQHDAEKTERRDAKKTERHDAKKTERRDARSGIKLRHVAPGSKTEIPARQPRRHQPLGTSSKPSLQDMQRQVERDIAGVGH